MFFDQGTSVENISWNELVKTNCCVSMEIERSVSCRRCSFLWDCILRKRNDREYYSPRANAIYESYENEWVVDDSDLSFSRHHVRFSRFSFYISALYAEQDTPRRVVKKASTGRAFTFFSSRSTRTRARFFAINDISYLLLFFFQRGSKSQVYGTNSSQSSRIGEIQP